MPASAKTVSASLMDVPAHRGEALTNLCQMCRSNLTGFEETMDNGSLCYKRNGQVEVCFASQMLNEEGYRKC